MMTTKQHKRLIHMRPGILWLAFLGVCTFLAGGCSSSGVSSAAVLPAADPTQAATATLMRPSVSVYAFSEEGYPAPHSEAAVENKALPAPVVVSSNAESGPPPTLTSVATAVLPTSTPAPTAAAKDPVTAQPTFTLPALPQTSGDDHYWLHRPVPQGGTVWTDKVYPYGSTRGRTLRTHHGVEFNVGYDTPILAAGSGTVVVAGSDAATAYGPQTNFYGNLVVIQHDFLLDGQPVYSLYGHLSQIMVTQGQSIQAQELIGLSGASGIADGPHMHFEVRVGANTYAATRNPLLWLWPFPERGSIAGRVVFENGAVAYEAPVIARRIDGSGPQLATTSYADNAVNPDKLWSENFVLDDVPAGYYEVEVKAGDEKYTVEVWVYERQTSFVEIVIQ